MSTLARMAAPYAAILLCWCLFRSAWLALLAYHLQILAWSWGRLRLVGKGWEPRLFLAAALPGIAAGPLAWILLPALAGPGRTGVWLEAHGLEGPALAWMVPYFGVVHPLLEQAHWSGLRGIGWPAHLAFAGYHALVLASLLPFAWVALCLAVLAAASAVWAFAERRSGSGLLICCSGHVLADLGLILAAAGRSP